MNAIQQTAVLDTSRRVLRLDTPLSESVSAGPVNITLYIRPSVQERGREPESKPADVCCPVSDEAKPAAEPDALEKCLREGIERLRGHTKQPERPKISAQEAIDWLRGCSKDAPGTVDDFLLHCRIEKEMELAQENPSVEDDYYAALARDGLSS